MNRIGWCDETWNPMTGCTPVSEACEHCYAKRMNVRFGCPGGDRTFRPHMHPERLDIPLHWRKPRRIFVCSMSDLFHEAFTDEQRALVFHTMQMARQHTYIVLTKRPENMRRYVRDWNVPSRAAYLPNLWLGVTVENQARANERIPILLNAPAAVRFVCCEPLLGPVTLDGTCTPSTCWHGDLDWVIVGGENGPGARPMQPDWALDIYRQCKAVGVPFWWKGWGSAKVDHRQSLYGPDLPDMTTTRETP